METTKIILVDDQSVYRNAMKTVLQRFGNVEIIAEAGNGKDFLNLLDSQKPDLVFMDIEMPEMNGIEATKQALKKNSKLTIIGLSMYDNENYVDELIAAGAQGYLLKLSDNYQIFKEILKYPKAEIFFSKEIAAKAKKTEKETRKTIVVVDDFEANTFAIGFALEKAGYTVHRFTSAQDALEVFDGRSMHLVVTDYNMPKMDGVDFIRAIRQISDYQNIPVLVLTTEKNEAKKQRAQEVGITGWVQKPFKLDRFLKTVEKAIR